MKWLRVIVARMRGVFRREALLEEMEEEMRSHVEMEEEANLERGMKPEEAREAARRSFGNLGRIRDRGYDIRGGGMMETFWQDLRYSARMIMKQPGFTIIAVVTLALGIGANTAIFSVVDRLLVRQLPVPEPESLVNVLGRDGKGGEDSSFSYPIYADYRDQNDVFDGLLAYSEISLNLSDGGQAERLTGVLVSGNYFGVLGVTAALGRTFSPDEDRTAGTHPVAVLSYGLWQRRFASDPTIIGRTITLNTFTFTVIGVGPAEFRGVRRGLSPDLYLPIQMITQAWPTRSAKDLTNRGFSWLNVMGRLKPGLNRLQAQDAMSSLSSRIEKNYPGFTWPMIGLEDGSQGETGEIFNLRTPLKLLFATVVLVLLIACVNIANLLLARAQTRTRELAVRLALGASRRRIIQQMLTESLLLSVLGGLLGLVLALWLTSVLAAYSPPTGNSSPPLLDATLDWRVLIFTIVLSLFTSLIFGLIPAWQSSKPNLTTTLKEETSTNSASGGRIQLRRLLVSAQIALSLIVLVGAGLCIRSLQKLQKIEAGFEAAKVLVVGLNLSLNGYGTDRGQQFYSNLLERASTLPGVEAVSFGRIVPLGGNGMRTSLSIEGYTPSDTKPINFDMNIVGPSYCSTMKLPLIAGRDFTTKDNVNSPPVVIINEAAARTYWANQDPIGKRLIFDAPGGRQPEAIEIIGVVRNSRYRSVTESYRPALMLSAWQRYTPDLSIHLRSAGDPAPLIEFVRSEVKALDPQLPLTSIRTLEEQRSNSLYSERVTALLLSAFGVLALLLAALGVYGVMSYAVTQRTREIGIRMALGAQTGDVLKLLLRQGVWLIIGGVAVGIAGALATTRWVRSFLYDVSVTDPLTFITVILLLIGVAMLACFVPARRATKVDPLTALRYE
jgi:putative ABC transport system permease protein